MKEIKAKPSSMEVPWFIKEIEELKEKVRLLQSEIVLSDGIIGSINQILEGNEASDFSLSFAIVRDVYDLYHSKIKKENQLRNERDALIVTLKDIVSIWNEGYDCEEAGERMKDLAEEMSDEWEI